MLILIPLFFLLFILFKLSSEGSFIYWSRRIGENGNIFKMPKIRTMKLNSPEIATNLLKNSREYVTPFGSFLRKSSLDELPQIWSVLKGDMSLVGPRPALINQNDLTCFSN